MRCSTLLQVSFLPATILAQMPVPHAPWSPYPTGPRLGGGATNGTNSSISIIPTISATAAGIPLELPTAYPTGLPPKHSANSTGRHGASRNRTKSACRVKTTHLPFSKYAAGFPNATHARGPTGTGEYYYMGTAASTGFAKPTGAVYSKYPTNVNTSTYSPHSPYTKSAGPLFQNSTAYGTGASTGFVTGTYPVMPTGAFPTASGKPAYTQPTSALFQNTTSRGAASTGFSTGISGGVPTGVFPTGVFPTGVFPTGVFPSGVFPSGVFPSGVFPTGVFPSGVFPTELFPSGVFPTGLFPTTSSAASIRPTVAPNSTVTVIPLPSLTSTPGSVHTVTVTLTAAPVTVTVGGTTVTTTQTFMPSAALTSAYGSATSSYEDEVTVTVIHSQATLPPSASVITSLSLPTTFRTAASTTSSVKAPASTPTRPTPPEDIIPKFQWCGGWFYNGSGSCEEGTVCKSWNPFYSQCV
ncbi:zinc finger protein [Marssonina coronariae]|uniref:Zinc finger protein n=1 Tax=Diplocarpon coronariae TaxID=2795749 RepID=A0A218ZDW0_9HELO|nr:zinc finger protein [Marssonina coronariae]